MDNIDVSISIASSAFCSGECDRVESFSSRLFKSVITSCSDRFSPISWSSLSLLSARILTSATINILNSASGNTTVPISRPSTTQLVFFPILRCISTMASRTYFTALTALTFSVTGIERIA